jgi:hypothetical protein
MPRLAKMPYESKKGYTRSFIMLDWELVQQMENQLPQPSLSLPLLPVLLRRLGQHCRQKQKDQRHFGVS